MKDLSHEKIYAGGFTCFETSNRLQSDLKPRGTTPFLGIEATDAPWRKFMYNIDLGLWPGTYNNLINEVVKTQADVWTPKKLVGRRKFALSHVHYVRSDVANKLTLALASVSHPPCLERYSPAPQ
ncbi:hypothetical protein EI94DRAFT_1192439 [Lactarius quietus]|nr:hypothetical protein EI94DRAFT_1192439 [Lactarius quietus]